jgi:predicted RNA-binding Zn ribbon-like protein
MFKFRGGHLALDLPATLTGRLRSEQRDLLASPADLARWLVAAGLVARKPAASDDDLRQARTLREALYRLAVARISGEPYAARDRAIVNRFAATPPPAPRLERDGMSWRREGVPTLLAVIARSAVELFGCETSGRIRRCSGEGCATLFVDNSRSGHRKWCSMAGCGNKAKVASFRSKLSHDVRSR